MHLKRLPWTEVIAVVVVVLFFGYIYISSPHLEENPIPAGIVPLPQGTQTYSISSSEKGPKMTELVIDSFNAREGQKQTMSIRASYEQPITEIKVVLKLDKGSYEYILQRVEGTDTDGRWEGSWTMPDNNDYSYGAVITARSGEVASNVEPMFR